jgi:hypothetical protein
MNRWRHVQLIARLALLATVGGAWAAVSPVVAQSEASSADASGTDDLAAPSLGPETVSRYRIGAKVVAREGGLDRLVVYMAVPLECPEQAVVRLEEDASPAFADIEYRQIDEGAAQMVITFAHVKPRDEAHAYATFEVRTRAVLPPRETAALKIPKKLTRSLRRYLTPSPMINVNHREIRAAMTDALASLATDASDWQRVEALYDYALKHVAYKLGDDKSSIQALYDGVGDCQAISALFVALCRTAKVPARMVWVDGHQYAEFYLESDPGTGRWFPVESAGTRAFGEMPLARVILQKGDAIRVPERPREQLRYASDYAVVPVPVREQPAVTYVRERLP